MLFDVVDVADVGYCELLRELLRGVACRCCVVFLLCCCVVVVVVVVLLCSCWFCCSDV